MRASEALSDANATSTAQSHYTIITTGNSDNNNNNNNNSSSSSSNNNNNSSSNINKRKTVHKVSELPFFRAKSVQKINFFKQFSCPLPESSAEDFVQSMPVCVWVIDMAAPPLMLPLLLPPPLVVSPYWLEPGVRMGIISRRGTPCSLSFVSQP